MESSAINSPHPDAPANEADLFFGGGEESPAAEAPAAEPEDKSGGWPDLSPEQAAAKAAEYRAQHGEPEPLHEQTAGAAKEAPAAGQPSAEPATGAGGISPASEEGDAAPEPDPTPTDADGATGSTTDAPEPDPQTDAGTATGEAHSGDAGADDGEGKKQGGELTREYIVFHQVSLTKRVLEHLLQQLEEGGEARIAHFELHRTTTRNVNHAVGDAYNTHKDRFGGQKAVMHAVSSKSFQKRTVEPRPVQVEASLSIK